MLKLFRWFLNILGPKRKNQWVWILALVVVAAFVELVSLGLLALFITSLTSIDQVMLSRFVVYGKSLLGEQWLLDQKLFYLSLGFVTVFSILIKNALTGLHNYATARFEGEVSLDIGVIMLEKYLTAPYRWSSAQNPSNVHTLIQWRLFVGFFPGHLIIVFSDLLVAALLFASMCILEPFLSLCVLAVLGGAGGCLFFIFKKNIGAYGSRSKDLNLLNSQESLRNINGLREIKVFNVASESLCSFTRHLEEYGRCVAVQKVLERATVWSLESIGFGGIIVGSILMINSSDYSSARLMGTLSLVAVSAWRILPSISRSISNLGTIRGYMPYLLKVKHFIETLEGFQTVAESIESQELPLLQDRIEINQLNFIYEGSSNKALSDVSFCISKGEMVGIVGHSGSGKSTLVDLLIGFLEPVSGKILVDGTVLDASSAKSWRDQLGLVSQSPYFFDGSLEDNIALTFGQSGVDQKLLSESCKLAGVDDFLDELPEGVKSSMGERGNLLSGGQAQRVAIARALYRNPEVLIFDEATSSLDDRNEKVVRETILGLKGRKTIIIIAHRLRAVKDCDKLVWLDNGRIVDCGPPEEILPRYVEIEKATAESGSERG